MDKDTEEKVIQFLRTLSYDNFWDLYEDDSCVWHLEWTKAHYEPKYVAQDLLGLIFPEGQDE